MGFSFWRNCFKDLGRRRITKMERGTHHLSSSVTKGHIKLVFSKYKDVYGVRLKWNSKARSSAVLKCVQIFRFSGYVSSIVTFCMAQECNCAKSKIKTFGWFFLIVKGRFLTPRRMSLLMKPNENRFSKNIYTIQDLNLNSQNFRV